MLERNRRESASEHLESADLAESAVPLGKSGVDSIEHWELSECLEADLAKIGEPCRELLLAHYFQPERSSYAEVAERLGRPVGSIGPTRARCP